jgi:hypothetical protein
MQLRVSYEDNASVNPVVHALWQELRACEDITSYRHVQADGVADARNCYCVADAATP